MERTAGYATHVLTEREVAVDTKYGKDRPFVEVDAAIFVTAIVVACLSELDH